ncbi:uncharacterized protein LOC115241722 [Formica exsecta]|uniref:uncharacterized protein LOC115241722 n=1 Tax=Formica exsecta TaxID=72781 RepID=UPI001141D787|nr:uncharacterized protein LOC115241722 [Formica exsecta]XP_029673493.1 uncharacterized protein LOC115241722 [Formica exsecta]XP_029673494.1 uncharacterized protein LOC115241722 [Formica exsecta]
MDAEAALLENSPTLSTISSDSTDATYSGPGSPYSPESPIIVTSSYKKKRDNEVTPRPTPRHLSNKPSFRIRPPYLMICISIIETFQRAQVERKKMVAKRKLEDFSLTEPTVSC